MPPNRAKNRSSARRSARTAKTAKTIDLEANKEKGAEAKKPAARSTAAGASASKKTSGVPIAGNPKPTATKSAEVIKPEVAASTVKPKSGNASSGKPAPEKSAPPKPTATKTQVKSANSFAGMFLSAILGGVITIGGLGIIGQMDGAGSLPIVGSIFAKGNSEKVDLSNLAERDTVSSLKAELQSEIDALTVQLKSVGVVDLSGIEQKIVALEQKGNVVSSGGPEQETVGRIDDLGAKAQANGAELVSLAKQIANLQTEIAAAGQVSQNDNDEVISQIGGQVSDMSDRLSELEARIGSELLSKIEAVTKIAEGAKVSEKIARSVAVSALQSSIEQNTPYLNALVSIEALTGSTVNIDRLKQLAADDNVPNLQMLQNQFRTLANNLIPATEDKADAGVLDRLMTSAKSLVKVRSSQPISGSTAEAVVSRIEAQLTAGNLAGVVEEWASLPDQSKAAGADWIKGVEMRIETAKLLQQVLDQASKG